MRSTLLLLLLASCVTPGEWQEVKQQTTDLRARYERNEREGWTKAEREAFRERLDRTSRRVDEVAPTTWETVGSYAGGILAIALAISRGGWPALMAMAGMAQRRRKRKEAQPPS